MFTAVTWKSEERVWSSSESVFTVFTVLQVLQSIWGVSMACLVRFWVVWELLEAASCEL